MYLLDTPAVSEPQQRRPNPEAMSWLHARDQTLLFTSVLVIGELKKGAAKLSEPERRAHFEAWFESAVLPWLRGRILPVTHQIADAWGEMCGRAEATGYSLPVVDSLIAATAIIHDFAVVTRNVRDFERCGARVVSPWSRAAG